MKHSKETIERRDGYVSAALEVWDSIIPLNKADARKLLAHSWLIGFEYGRKIGRKNATPATSGKRPGERADR